MNAWRWTDGAFEPCESLPISDRGFRYGMAVFESFRIWRSRPLFWEAHSARLRKACADRDLHVPGEALAAAEQVMRSCGDDNFVRIYVTAGDGTVVAPADHCRVFIVGEERDRPTVSAYHLAMPIEMHQPIFGGLKTTSYWPNVDVLQRALRNDRHEALLFNEHAELVSACMANVFLVNGTGIRTPSLACGARDGVLREWVMSHEQVKEGSLFIEDLQSAEEVFITNSWIGVMPAASVDGRALRSTAVGDRLAAELKAFYLAQPE